MQACSHIDHSGMILQPDSSPISQEQLAAEIKGIYEGVATVEAKCIDIDAALTRPTHAGTHLGVEQWQALIALHRTLLYEHHDFLMATQHPSASPQLRSLATKYGMPARMWKHGIHAFLEVPRHRRPKSQDESQDFMLAFVELAYQMLALLFETVPCFTDTWIECLGDLARYRMAIEDDRKTQWGMVAARWYTLASDRYPEIGRLYHHLGILERPSMRKMALYAKSLTCSIPFVNARDSISTFCTPIVQEEQLSKSNIGSAEAILVIFYALVFAEQDLDAFWLERLSGGSESSTGTGHGNHAALSYLEVYQELRRTLSASRQLPRRWWEDEEAGRPETVNDGGGIFQSGKAWLANDVALARFADLANLPAGPSNIYQVDQQELKASRDSSWAWKSGDFWRSLPTAGGLAAGFETFQRKPSVLISDLLSRTIRAALTLFLTTCIPIATAHPVRESPPRPVGMNIAHYLNWLWPLIPITVGCARAYAISQKPLERLEVSSFSTNFEIGSAAAFLLVQAVSEPQSAANLFILGCWFCFWLVGTTTRYRLTARQFQHRYLVVVAFGGAVAAVAMSSVFAMVRGGLPSSQVARQGLNLMPLGWSSFAWILYSAWRHSKPERRVPGADVLTIGESRDVELEASSNFAPRAFLGSLYHRGTISSDNPWVEEEPALHRSWV